MIGIKQSPSCSAAVGGKRTRSALSALGWLALLSVGACGNGQKSGQQETNTLVRPATSAPGKVEEVPEAALPPESGDLPRGVSPPQLSPEEASAQEPEAEPPTEPPARTGKTPASSRASAKLAQVVKAPATQDVKAPAKPKPPRAATAREQPRSTPAPQPTAAVAEPVAPPPAPAPIAPVAAKRVSVQVPSTEHVRVDVPAGLQGWLDADDRMRPWLGKAIAVADSCYAKLRADNAAAAGEIAVQLTMHENARPSGRVASTTPALSGITMCATTRLLGVKMPLFTGTEGETYTVRVRFSP